VRSLLLICADSAAFICRVSTQITGKPASSTAIRVPPQGQYAQWQALPLSAGTSVRRILSRFNGSDDVRTPNFGPLANN
jgi:hypothetical protein